ncbi:MAG: hypothetical protein SGI96_18435 [Bacteroidota bacterium]|nr:hypothetical protein [Bacteroidota bacterium]
MTTQEPIKLVAFKTEYIQVYKECFGNPIWRQLYGVDKGDFNFKYFIENSVLVQYPSVERLIILDKTDNPIFFAHLCNENETCVVVGGIIPSLINSGRGIYCSLFIFDYIFKSKNTKSISVLIKKLNSTSLKMVQSFGFRAIEKTNSVDDTTISLQLKREDFPNTFARELLSKSKYEKK